MRRVFSILALTAISVMAQEDAMVEEQDNTQEGQDDTQVDETQEERVPDFFTLSEDCFKTGNRAAGDKSSSGAVEISDRDILLSDTFDVTMSLASLKGCKDDGELVGIMGTLVSSEEGAVGVDLNLIGRETGDCTTTSADLNDILDVDIYTGDWVNGIRIDLIEGSDIELGKKNRRDDTRNWDLTDDQWKLIGMTGQFKDNRILSLTPIMYDSQCGLSAYQEWSDAKAAQDEADRLQREAEEAEAARLEQERIDAEEAAAKAKTMSMIYIIVGVVVGLALIITIVCCLKKRAAKQNSVQNFDTSKDVSSNAMVTAKGPDAHPTLVDNEGGDIQLAADFGSKPSSQGKGK